jgi:hypothetical protein
MPKIPRAANDIDGSAAQGGGSESGEERINLLPNAVITFVKLRRQLIGLIDCCRGHCFF